MLPSPVSDPFAVVGIYKSNAEGKPTDLIAQSNEFEAFKVGLISMPYGSKMPATIDLSQYTTSTSELPKIFAIGK